MPYDTQLEDRVRALMAGRADVSERRMFGGLGFLVGGNMAVAASAEGLMVRVDPADCAHLQATTTATPMVMQGRTLSGWLRLCGDEVRTKRQLAPWVQRGATFAASLPAKR